jgi:DNA-directed RNA polymerase specialized sigma24 family protein
LLRPLLGAHLVSLGADQRMLDALLDRVFLQIHAARRTWSPGFPVEGWAQAIAQHVLRTEGRPEGSKWTAWLEA